MAVFIAGARTTGPVKARYKRRQKIVRQSMRELGQQIGGGGRHHQNVTFFGDRDMFHRA